MIIASETTLILFGVLVLVGLSVFLIRDSKNRRASMEKKVDNATVAIAQPLIYPKYPTEMQFITGSSNFCEECGHKFNIVKNFCPKCGTKIHTHDPAK